MPSLYAHQDMFNTGAKKQAIERLQTEVQEYEKAAGEVRNQSQILFDKRRYTEPIIKACERYLSELAGAPKELQKSIGELRVHFQSFEATIQHFEAQSHDIAFKSGGMAAGGVATGVGVAAFAPTAAMAIATTFGTASTGTAIASLSGAAATNAALAWLGGGALAAGGGGMSAGGALLALAGPVGWAIGGVALVGAGGYSWFRNGKVAEQIDQKSREVARQKFVLDRAWREIIEVRRLTDDHSRGVRDQLAVLRQESPSNYVLFKEQDKLRLGALINNVNALAELIDRRIEINA